MIDYTGIRDSVIQALHDYVGRPVVMLDQAAPKPAHPFLGYKITSALIPERGLAAETGRAVPSADPAWEHDHEYMQQSQPTMVISLTAYSRDSDEAAQLALQAQTWFATDGYEQLKGAGIIVVSTGSVQSRDTLLVDDYERRQGFDIVLRVTSRLIRTVPTIEHVNIKSDVR